MKAITILKVGSAIAAATALGVASAAGTYGNAPAPSSSTSSEKPMTSQAGAAPMASATGGLPSAAIKLSRNDSASEAFAKLDPQHRGFVTQRETLQIEGFGPAFAHADRNGDGKLDRDEFAAAWNEYAHGAMSGSAAAGDTGSGSASAINAAPRAGPMGNKAQ